MKLENSIAKCSIPYWIKVYLILINSITSIALAYLLVNIEVHYQNYATLAILISIALQLFTFLAIGYEHITLILISFRFKETTFSLFSFYLLLTSVQLKTNLKYYTLIGLFIYFSLIGLLTCVVLENLDKFQTKSASLRHLAFLLLFRYFFFIWKWLSILLLIASLNDDLNWELKLSIKLSLYIYLISSLTVYFIWHYFHISKKSRLSILNRFIQSIYEAFTLLFDYSHNYLYCSNAKLLESQVRNGLIKKVSFFLALILVQLYLGYLWYYRTVLTYTSNLRKTSLFTLLTKINTGAELMNLAELEEKIKLRQMLLVVISGSIFISILCYHIYYSYYYEETLELYVKDESTTIPRSCPTETGQVSISVVDNINEIDGFSFDSYQQSSSISSSSVSPTFKQKIKCSTCSETNLEETLSLSLMQNAAKSTVRHDRLSHFYSLRPKKTEHDTSSGIISSTSSLSSVYHNLSYFKNLEDWNTKLRSNITLSVKSEPKNVSNENFEDKIMVWFKKNSDNGLDFSEPLNLPSDKHLNSTKINEKSFESYLI